MCKNRDLHVRFLFGRRDGINTVDEGERERQSGSPHLEEKVEEVAEGVEHPATGLYHIVMRWCLLWVISRGESQILSEILM